MGWGERVHSHFSKHMDSKRASVAKPQKRMGVGVNDGSAPEIVRCGSRTQVFKRRLPKAKETPCDADLGAKGWSVNEGQIEQRMDLTGKISTIWGSVDPKTGGGARAKSRLRLLSSNSERKGNGGNSGGGVRKEKDRGMNRLAC